MRDKDIEKEFRASWDWIEQYYADLLKSEGWEYLTPISDLIADLRKRGYDGHLRAGQSMWWLILSRSRKWGLRDEQHNIVINLRRDGGMVVEYVSPSQPVGGVIQQGLDVLDLGRAEFSRELEAMLARLLLREVDSEAPEVEGALKRPLLRG